MRTTTRRNTLDIALDVLRCGAMAQDAERWITVKPNGEENKGRPVLIEGETGEIKAGMGGKFTGRNIDDVPRGKNPHPVTEAKYQARQKRMAEKQAAEPGNIAPQQPSQQQAEGGRSAFREYRQRIRERRNSEEAKTAAEAPFSAGFVRAKYQGISDTKDLQLKEKVKQFQKGEHPPGQSGFVHNGMVVVPDTEVGYGIQPLASWEEATRKRITSLGFGGPGTPEHERVWEKEKRRVGLTGNTQQPPQPAQPQPVPVPVPQPQQPAQTPPVTQTLRQRPVAPDRPEGIPDGYWNGKVYSGNRVYINGRERKLSPEKIEALQKWYSDYQKYKEAREIDTRNAPKQYLNVAYKDREKAKKAGARWDPTVGKWYWDKRDGDIPEKLSDFGTIDSSLRDVVKDSDLAADADNPDNYEEMRGASGGHLALDRSSVRTVDENGYLHVKSSHITKATVNPYYGREIPGWREEGLDPDKVYQGFRDPEELRKSVPTWAGLPLHIEHHIDSAEDPQKLTRVGTVGTEIRWNEPYIDAPLTIWDQTAIDGIEDGSFRELSCAYRYDPDFTPGTWNGKRYDFVMRNIRGNHVALVEEGRAGSDVLVADAKPATFNTRSLKPKKEEGLMSRFMKWFRGAQDGGDPAVEKKEVDLAQAIIDLHRKDPVTGEIRDDVSEDADKAAEVRVLVERLKGKIPPDDYERLFGAIAALAAEEEAQDEEGQLMFEETKGRKEEDRENIHADAMRAAGCDAEDPDEARAFAGGVKYGEELERNPAEREKLDREHESEGMRRAMDACGVDAENPSETRAFAEGVKYGEENARQQKAEDEDPEDEDKPVGDEDKNAIIDKILAAVPDLTDEQKKKIADTLSDLAYSPATGDEELEKKVEGAADRAFRRRRFLGATDAARIRAQATSDAMARMRDIAEACRVVRPLVGEMDSLAFDSANDVYGYTLEQMGKRPRKYDRKAWRGMVEMLLDNHAALAVDTALRAREAKRIPDAGPFRYLKNITVG